MTIWKYTLEVTDQQTVYMPKGAKILTVQTQHGEPRLWALCNPENPKEGRLIVIHGTGQPVVVDPEEYIGTFQVRDGQFVFHVFDKG